MTLVAAELLASVVGLGYVMTVARRSADPAMILAPMLIIALLLSRTRGCCGSRDTFARGRPGVSHQRR